MGQGNTVSQDEAETGMAKALTLTPTPPAIVQSVKLLAHSSESCRIVMSNYVEWR